MALQVLWQESATGYVRTLIVRDVFLVTGYGEEQPPQPPLYGYFVSASDGDDAYDGSLEAPFKTISRGIQAASAGDTVYVRQGNYVERVRVAKSGTPGNPITIRAYPAERPTINGEYQYPEGELDYIDPVTGMGFVWSGLVEIEGSHIVLDGFRITKSRGRAIHTPAPAPDEQGFRDITIRDCIIHDIRSGGIVILETDGVIIEDCTVFRTDDHAVDGHSGYAWTPGIYPRRCWNVTVQRNLVYANYGEGLVCSTVGGVFRDNVFSDNVHTNMHVHTSSDVVIERNLIYVSESGPVAKGLTIGLDQAIPLYPDGAWYMRSAKVLNNIVIGAELNFAYVVYDSFSPVGDYNGGLIDCTIANNTFMHANLNGNHSNPSACYCVYFSHKGTIRNSVFKNNICIQDPTTGAAMARIPAIVANNVEFDYNCWNPQQPSGAAGANDVIGDPKMYNSDVSPSPGEVDVDSYKLQSNSPCIDRGVTIADVLEDYWRTGRPQQSAYDIGAHEYDGA